MTQSDSQFFGYLVDQYLKVQIVTDPNSKVCKVEDIPNININANFGSSGNGSSSSNKLKKLAIHSSSEMFKELFKNLEFLIQSQTQGTDPKVSKGVIINQLNFNKSSTSSLIKFYNTYSDNIKGLKHYSMKEILNMYTKSVEVIPGCKRQENPEVFYTNLINFIDLLINLKGESSQKHDLKRERTKLMETWFFKVPDVDPKLVKSTARSFKINPQIVEERINILRVKYTCFDLYNDLKTRKGNLLYGYSSTDFVTKQGYDIFLNEMESRFTHLVDSVHVNDSFSPKVVNSVIPNDSNDLSKLIDSLLQVIVNNKHFQDGLFFKNILKCFDCWLVDPFDLVIKFLTMVLNSKHIYNDEGPENIKGGEDDLDLNWTNAMFTFSQALMPSALVLNFPTTWPQRMSSKYLNLLHNFYLIFEDFLIQNLAKIFNQNNSISNESISNVLTLISFIELNKSDFQILQEKLMISLNNRVETSIANLTKLFKDASSYRDLTNCVDVSIEELNFLIYIKVQFRQLNAFKTININASIAKLVNLIYSQLQNKFSQLSNNPKFDNSFMIDFLTSLNNFKTHPSVKNQPFDFNFQKLSADLYKMVSNDWKTELHDRCKTAIKADQASNYERLPNVSFSKSVQTVIELCESYTNVLNDFQFNDDFEKLALIYASLTSSICDNLIYYSNVMVNHVIKNIKVSHSSEYPSKSMCTCLNNTLQIMNYLKEIDTSNFDDFSKALSNHNKRRRLQILNLKIVNLENVEEEGGKPPSLKVKVNGLSLNGETSLIYKDFNPQYDETFRITNIKDGKFTFEIKNDIGAVYRAVTYSLNSNIIPKQVRLSLEPKPGNLNVEFLPEVQIDDPVYYIGRAISEVLQNYQFMVKSIVLNLLEPFKDFFNRLNLAKSLKDRPVQKNQVTLAQESYIEDYITSLKFNYLYKLYSNLEDEVFAEIFIKMWDFILSYTENLVLPRLSTVYNKINAKLNRSKRISMSSVFSSKNSLPKISTVTKNEITRVYEWIDRFYQQLVNTDDEYIHAYHETGPSVLKNEYRKFQEYKVLLNMREEELKTMYSGYWTAFQSVIIRQLKIKLDNRAKGSMKYGTKSARKELKVQESEINDLQTVLDKREVILRVLLALYSPNSNKFVKCSLERQERYLRAMDTELELDKLLSQIS